MRTAECVINGCVVLKWHRASELEEAGACLRCECAVFRARKPLEFDSLVVFLAEARKSHV